MKATTKIKLLQAWQYYDDKDKSTDYMIHYMKDFAGVDEDCVINFIMKTTLEERRDFVKTRNQKK